MVFSRNTSRKSQWVFSWSKPMGFSQFPFTATAPRHATGLAALCQFTDHEDAGGWSADRMRDDVEKKALVGWWFFNGIYNLYGTYSWYSWFMAFIVDIVDLYGIYIWDYGIYMVSWCSPNHQYYLVGGLEHEFYDRPFSWEFHHPNWRTHIFQRGRYTTNQL